jgi:hypothetical protein
MTPTLVKNFIVLCICVLLALIFSFAVATESYSVLVLPVMLSLLAATIVLPGYGFLLAFGLVCPFILPLPFVWGMPMLLFILGLCGLKYILRRALGNEQFVINYNLPIIIFFTWVLIRYCMNPVKPGIALGLSQGVTGFRAYVNYALCAAVFFAVGLFKDERDIAKMLRWMCGLSMMCVLLFLPLMFTKSLTVANVLGNLGVFVTSFDNGWLRFVVLPEFGLVLVTTALLPNLFKLGKSWRVGAILLGVAAIIMGGNRSSLVMLFAVAVVFGFFRYRSRGLIATLAGVLMCLLAMFYVGETEPNIDPALYRLTALVSPHAARITEAEQTVEWRKVRWDRAMEDIREHPIVGMSYGGLENAFVFASFSDYERATVDIDVASGSIHNGYLANARSLGIPSLVLFVMIFLWQILKQMREALKVKQSDPLKSELHAYLCMNLICIGFHIYIGIDLNTPLLWFILGLCVLLVRKKPVAVARPAMQRSPVLGRTTGFLPA